MQHSKAQGFITEDRSDAKENNTPAHVTGSWWLNRGYLTKGHMRRVRVGSLYLHDGEAIRGT